MPAGIFFIPLCRHYLRIMQKSNRFVLLAAVLAVLFLLAGCVGRPKQNAAAQAQAETSGSGAPADSCEIPVRHNEACLALFELTGPVEYSSVECWQTGTAEREYEEADMLWGRDYGFNRRGYLVFDGHNKYTYRADTVFLYGKDARAGMSVSLTYDAAGRIVAENREYEGNAEGDGAQSTELN